MPEPSLLGWVNVLYFYRSTMGANRYFHTIHAHIWKEIKLVKTIFTNKGLELWSLVETPLWAMVMNGLIKYILHNKATWSFFFIMLFSFTWIFTKKPFKINLKNSIALHYLISHRGGCTGVLETAQKIDKKTHNRTRIC